MSSAGAAMVAGSTMCAGVSRLRTAFLHSAQRSISIAMAIRFAMQVAPGVDAEWLRRDAFTAIDRVQRFPGDRIQVSNHAVCASGHRAPAPGARDK